MWTFVKIYLHRSKNDKLESTLKNTMISEVIQKFECFKYNEYIKILFSSPASICPYIYVAYHCSSKRVAVTNNIQPTVQAACVQRARR